MSHIFLSELLNTLKFCGEPGILQQTLSCQLRQTWKLRIRRMHLPQTEVALEEKCRTLQVNTGAQLATYITGDVTDADDMKKVVEETVKGSLRPLTD